MFGNLISKVKKIKYERIVFVFSEFNWSGGATKPIVSYIKGLQFEGRSPSYLFLNQKGSFLKLIVHVLVGNRVFINGLYGCRNHWMKLIVFLKSDTIVYLHESSPYFKHFQSISTLNQLFLKRILSNREIFYCSAWQYENTKSFLNPKRKQIVYNCLSLSRPAMSFVSDTREVVKIVMVGYIQKRKGIELFQQVAQTAAELNLNWEFTWIGGKGSSDLFEPSNFINYIGNVDDSTIFINKANVLLLTSEEDPLPLVVLQALLLKKKIVSFTENGYLELLSDTDGIAFFEKRDPRLVVDMISQLLKKDVDQEKYNLLIEKLCVTDSFSERMEKLI